MDLDAASEFDNARVLYCPWRPFDADVSHTRVGFCRATGSGG